MQLARRRSPSPTLAMRTSPTNRGPATIPSGRQESKFLAAFCFREENGPYTKDRGRRRSRLAASRLARHLRNGYGEDQGQGRPRHPACAASSRRLPRRLPNLLRGSTPILCSRHYCSHVLPPKDFQSTRPCGARRAEYFDGIGWVEFQSTRPRGARRHSSPSPFLSVMFQSTRPRGARPPRHQPRNPKTICFNPRARAGRDMFPLSVGFAPSVFQSTRPRGARLPYSSRMPPARQVSIHAPARGATFIRGAVHAVAFSFNPRARAGRDPRGAVA